MRCRVLLTGTMAILLLVVCHSTIVLAGAEAEEAEVKAAFVFNFIKFVEWPSSAFQSSAEPVLLTVLGNDPIGAALASLDGKKVFGRRVVVRKTASISGLERCHVLFVGAAQKWALPAVFRAIQRWPVLTIADIEGFPDRGGTIGFVRRGDKIGFEINEEAARKVGLDVSAKLLYLGKSAHARQGGER